MLTAATIADKAALLRSRGFALCSPDPGTKNPTYPGWPTRSLEPRSFTEGDMLGIIAGPLSDGNLPGHALVIIDLDSLPAIEKADEFLPATAMEEGRAGKPRSHRYYLVRVGSIPDEALSTATQAAPAALKQRGHPGPKLRHFPDAETGKNVIDFVGTGGQCVAPPSTHPSGELREWTGGEPGLPAVVDYPDLWTAVCKLADACGWKPQKASKPKRQGARIRGLGGDVLERARLYLDKCEPAVSGQGGHKALLWAARAMCWGFDLGADVGFELLRDEYNARCQPEWSEAELWHKAEDADTVAFDRPRGWLRDEDRHQGNGQPSPPAPKPPGGDSPTNTEVSDPAHLTDLGNARRIVKRHGGDLHFCHQWKTWLVWDGRRWAEDLTGEAVRRVKETQGTLYQWAAAKLKEIAEAPDDDGRKGQVDALTRVLNHALKWEDARRIAASLELAKSEPSIPVIPDELDRDPWLLNCLNGTLDLRTGRLREHDREDQITKLVPVAYDANATCPLWLKFLDRVMDGNEDLITYLQRVVGYSLTGDVSEQALWFFHGTGANGKSTFLTTLLAMLGDYAMQAVSDLLMVKNHESHPTERADLFGKRFVATIETEQGKRMAEALMKQMTGGDKIRARRMRQDFFEFAPTHKIFLAANHKPVIRGTDHAAWRRIKLAPFEVTISEEEKDKALPEKLKTELPGVLNWALEGCLDWQRYGLGEPDEVRQATSNYQAEQDTIQAFLNECCFIHPEVKTKSSLLLETYHVWSGDRLMSRQAFGERLRDKGFTSDRGHGGSYFWQRIGLPADSAGEHG